MNSDRFPHVSQLARDGLEDLGLVDSSHDHDGQAIPEFAAVHVEVGMAS